MLRLAYVHFVLLLLAVTVLGQTTAPCTCTATLYWGTYTFKKAITGSASCTSLKLTPTCPTSTPSSTSKTSTVVTPTSSKPTSTSTTPKPSSSLTPTPTSTPKPSSTTFFTSTTSPKPSTTSTPTSSRTPTSSKLPSTSTSTSTPKPSSSSTPTPSSTSTACTPTPTNKSNASAKRGVSYNSSPLTNLFSTSCVKSKASWSYNWYSAPATDGQASAINTALTFIPMLWSAADSLTAVWNANANAAIANGAKALLSFNEPDGCGGGGSCMNVTYAVQSYKSWMQPFAGKARLSSPGVTNGGSPAGLTYLQNFVQACSGCTIDFVSIHWYSDASQISQFKSYVQQAYSAGGNRPLWITEFGCTSGTDAQVQAFMKDVLPWLDSQSYVERYAYFMAAPQNPSSDFLWQETLVNSAGTALSNTGIIYDQI